MPKPIAIAVKDAQLVLGVGRTTIYGLLAAGRLQRLKIGRRTLISTKSLKAFAAELSSDQKIDQ